MFKQFGIFALAIAITSILMGAGSSSVGSSTDGSAIHKKTPNQTVEGPFTVDGSLVCTQNFTIGGGYSIFGSRPDAANAVAVPISSSSFYGTAGAKIVSFRNNGTEKAYVDKDGIGTFAGGINTNGAVTATGGSSYIDAPSFVRYTSNGPVMLKGNSLNGASAIATKIDNYVTLSTTGAKLLSILNNGTEKAYIDKDGGFTNYPASMGTGYVACGTVNSVNDSTQRVILSNASSTTIQGNVPDGASAVGTIFNNIVTLSNATSKISSFRNNGTEKLAVDLNGVLIGASTQTVKGSMGNGASAVGVIVDTLVTYSTAGAKILSARTGNNEKAYVDYTGAGVFNGGVNIGAGTLISKSNRLSFTWDIASTATAACAAETSQTVTGAVANAECAMSLPAAFEAGWVCNCYVSAANTVKGRCCNLSGAVSDPASATFSFRTFNP